MSRKLTIAAALWLVGGFLASGSSAMAAGVDDLVKKAEKAIIDGKYKDAVAALDQAIATAPDRTELYGLRAKANDERGDMDKALEDANKMIQMAPNDSEGYLIRAGIYRRNEKFPEALADANKAIELDPKSVDAYYMRSDIYHDMGKTAESKADEAKANQLDH
ncbi:MAG: tetratricopeptide repeat protein [Steroidobacteraceae bacterium]